MNKKILTASAISFSIMLFTQVAFAAGREVGTNGSFVFDGVTLTVTDGRFIDNQRSNSTGFSGYVNLDGTYTLDSQAFADALHIPLSGKALEQSAFQSYAITGQAPVLVHQTASAVTGITPNGALAKPDIFYGDNRQGYSRTPTAGSFVGSNGVTYTSAQVNSWYDSRNPSGLTNRLTPFADIEYVSSHGMKSPDLYKFRYLAGQSDFQNGGIYTDPKEYDAYAPYLRAEVSAGRGASAMSFQEWRAKQTGVYLASLQSGSVYSGGTSLTVDVGSTGTTTASSAIIAANTAAVTASGLASPNVFYGYNGKPYTKDIAPTATSFLASNDIVYTKDQIVVWYAAKNASGLTNSQTYGADMMLMAELGWKAPDLYKARMFAGQSDFKTGQGIFNDPKELVPFDEYLKAEITRVGNISKAMSFTEWRAKQTPAYLASLQLGQVENAGWINGPRCGVVVNTAKPATSALPSAVVPVTTCSVAVESALTRPNSSVTSTVVVSNTGNYGVLSQAAAQVTSANVVDTNSESCLSIPMTLSYQSKDSATSGFVTKLQNFLHATNYLSSQATGFFGAGTFKAVKAFQRANGISQTGQTGPNTRAKIKEISCAMQGTQLTDNDVTLSDNAAVSNLPVGCTSTSGFSPTTGIKCSIISLPEGCTSNTTFSPVTGVRCVAQ